MFNVFFVVSQLLHCLLLHIHSAVSDASVCNTQNITEHYFAMY